ncbi:contact-dependent growth inhibition system immunity protein [Streptomyces sp. BE147]|uniref:contact-dependent growth inhibition system immunity protein n=1 Tax=unclassified Streptomyces TaxID=2593676 RepID=UPI002E76A0CF|nr:contact-dependent growth inhibition system immunity protein [Streptomyces sp. BE147]MEE1739367.1 contact-dependent growth inhibition system immunity protein [Streptomyces sp. BE147]
MPLTPLQHDSSYGELDQVLHAYAGLGADDTPERPSEALAAYLRHTWHTRPHALAAAEAQLRSYARTPPGPLRLRLGEFYPVPDVGLDEDAVRDWLLLLADHLRRSIEAGEVPPPCAPRTHWEWHARFPELGQLLGGWFSQDMPDEAEDHDAALQDYLDTTDRSLVTRLAGELHELLALGLDEDEYTVGLTELGLEVDPPDSFSHGAWLVALAHAVLAAGGTGRQE